VNLRHKRSRVKWIGIGLLAVVGLEVTKEGIGLVQVQRDRGTEFQILGAAMLKL